MGGQAPPDIHANSLLSPSGAGLTARQGSAGFLAGGQFRHMEIKEESTPLPPVAAAVVEPSSHCLQALQPGRLILLRLSVWSVFLVLSRTSTSLETDLVAALTTASDVA